MSQKTIFVKTPSKFQVNRPFDWLLIFSVGKLVANKCQYSRSVIFVKYKLLGVSSPWVEVESDHSAICNVILYKFAISIQKCNYLADNHFIIPTITSNYPNSGPSKPPIYFSCCLITKPTALMLALIKTPCMFRFIYLWEEYNPS